MIQFKRGTTESWKKQKKPLAAGQPGYDKDKHKIKVGDGEKLWDKLPYASISEEEVLDSEKNARLRIAFDPESLAIMTYGTESPDENTVGKLYLQYYDTEPEADYVIEMGSDGIWSYRKWKSGIAECYGTYRHTTALDEPLAAGILFYNNVALDAIKYPTHLTFVDGSVPYETVTLQSAGATVWLAGKTRNSNTKSGTYTIIGTHETDIADYYLTFSVKGRWKK